MGTPYPLVGPEEDQVLVVCSACDGEGGRDVYIGRAPDGADDGYFEPCPYCNGSGEEIVWSQPIVLDDLYELEQPR